jgi:hypothetical protein
LKIVCFASVRTIFADGAGVLVSGSASQIRHI